MTDLDVTFRDERDWVSFGQSYVSSEPFKALFREGMALVEETAAYLDGEGREDDQCGDGGVEPAATAGARWRSRAASRRCHRSAFLTGLRSAVRQPFFFQPWIQAVTPFFT